MHHFSKQIHKKLWYHIALSVGSALVSVALFDLLCSLSWLCKDYELIANYNGVENSTTASYNILDILYWIFVAYRMVLSLVICIGGIFMGRRIIVIVWLLVSLLIDMIHLSETIFILSKPNLVKTWPITVAVSSCIWQELKIIRIKYRIIRRSYLVDTNNNDQEDYEYEPETFRKGIRSHLDPEGKFYMEVVNTVALCNIAGMGMGIGMKINQPSESKITDNYNNNCGKLTEKDFPKTRTSISKPDHDKSDRFSKFVAANAIHFVKLLRNLYNLLTWHFTGYLFGGDYLHLILNTNDKAIFLEQSFICYVRIFLDVLTVIYIVQEKKLLLTPWIMAYIMTASASIAVLLFTLLHLNLLTTLFAFIYYLVFAIDLFFRCSFLIFCVRYVFETKRYV